MAAPVHAYQGAPGTAMTLLYTAPIADSVRVESILASNVTATAATVTIEHVPKGASPGTGYMLANAQSVTANSETNVLTTGASIVMNPGDMLYASQGTAAAVNLEINGTQYPYGS